MVNTTLEYIANKFNIDVTEKPPIERSVNRTVMARTLGELGFKIGAEVGVAQGHHAKMLCENVPGLKLYCVDIWGRYPGYEEYYDRIERYYLEAKEKLAPYDCVFVKKFSMDAVKDFEDNSLDFVYIDGAHDFKSVAEDICEWTKKVRVGGIVYGHDYQRRYVPKHKYAVQVKDVVQAYMYSHRIRPWFVLNNAVHDPFFGRDVTGWMFVRQDTDALETYRRDE